MRRNRIGQLNTLKSRIPRDKRTDIHQEAGMVDIPWYNEYYHYKQQLSSVVRKNEEDVKYFLNQYQRIPTLFNLRQLQSQLNINCRKIDQIDRWTRQFGYTNISLSLTEIQKNMMNYFRLELGHAVRKIFAIRQSIIKVHSQSQGPNMVNSSMNMSFQSVNASTININERNDAINDISKRIDNLNSILKRMGDLTVLQGDIVNRIDSNLLQGYKNVKLGNAQLKVRADRQTCANDEDQQFFGCSSKVNTIINAMYLINLALIIVLVVKNL